MGIAVALIFALMGVTFVALWLAREYFVMVLLIIFLFIVAAIAGGGFEQIYKG